MQQICLILIRKKVSLRFDYKLNCVVIDEIDPNYLKELYLYNSDKGTFISEAPRETLADKLNWPKYFRSGVKQCCLNPDLFALFGFSYAMHFWDATNIPRVLWGENSYPLAVTIFNTEVNPACFLPNVPKETGEAEEYIEIARNILDIIAKIWRNNQDVHKKYVEIKLPAINGVITEEMQKVAAKFKEGLSNPRARQLGEDLRRMYCDLTLSKPASRQSEFVFYDYGVNKDMEKRGI